MKRCKFFLVVLLMNAAAPTAHAAIDFSGKKADVSQGLAEPSRTIPFGEHLVYEVFWMGVSVGTGELSVKEKTQINGRDCFHVVALAETNNFLSRIYPVHDEVHSWIDAHSLQSLQFEKKVSEGFYRADERVVYDEQKKKGYYESLKNGGKKEFGVAVPVHDILSAFFWVRRQRLVPGSAVKTLVNSDEKDWGLEIEVLRREQKELRGKGVFDTILIEPKTRLKGVLEKRGRVWIHLQNDATRVPVLVTFKTGFGPIVGVLRKDL